MTLPPHLTPLYRAAHAAFACLYARPPQHAAAAPGRVNLIGEHTDYNDGFVLPMAIEHYTLLLAAPSPDSNFHLATTTSDVPAAHLTPAQALQPGQPHWTNYLRGVFAGFTNLGTPIPPLQILVASNVPTGAGLSSSAALEVATATLLESVTGRTLDPAAKALLCQRAEHDFANVPCGIMDQFISVMGQAGHAMLLDCRSREPQMVPLDDPEIAILIANTNVHHELAAGEYAQHRAQCEQAARLLGVRSLRDADVPDLARLPNRCADDLLFRRARHVITENQRTQDAAAALRRRDWPAFGKLMFASHASLRADYEVSCPELDLLVQLALTLHHRDGSILGARMTGGGFGGCTVNLIRTQDADLIIADLHRHYTARTARQPTLFLTHPAPGAMILPPTTTSSL